MFFSKTRFLTFDQHENVDTISENHQNDLKFSPDIIFIKCFRIQCTMDFNLALTEKKL